MAADKHLEIDCATGEVSTRPLTKEELADRAERAQERHDAEAASGQAQERIKELRDNPARTHEENLELTDHLADLLGVTTTEE